MKDSINILVKGASSEIKKDGYDIQSINSISKWLKKRGIININETLLIYKDIIEWQRGGGETFFTIFEIEYLKENTKINKKIVIKALATLFPEKSLENWTRRRNILEKNDIPVSKWYYNQDGIIIEDYYEKIPNITNFATLMNIAKMLDKLGFSPLYFIRDLRCNNNNDVFYIDFGFDLGEPTGIPNTVSQKQLLKFKNK